MLDSNRYREAAARDPLNRPVVFVPHRIAIAFNLAVLVTAAALAFAQTMRTDILGFFAIGLGIGIATCIPIGIANVIVIDAAYRHGARRAFGACLGGTAADGIYASLGIFGIGPLIESYPTVPIVLHSISGCVLLVYGIVLLRSQPAMTGTLETRPSGHDDGHLMSGFMVGLFGTLLNPSAIVTWVVIVGGHATRITRVEQTAWVAGIIVGTFAWFLVVMTLALKGRRVLREKAVWMTRIVGLVVIGSGAVSFARVLGF